MERSVNRRWGPIFPVRGEIVAFPRGATPAARASPPDWSRVGGGRALGQLDWGSENAGMKVICLLYCIRQPGSIIRLKVDQEPYTPAPSLPDVRLVSLSTRGHQPLKVSQSARIMMILRENYRPPIPSPCSPGTLNAFRAMLLRMV